MADFNASINLNVSSTGAERQIKKLERSVERVEDKSRDILAVDQKIVSQRRILLTLSGEQATKAKKRLTDLRLQRSELSLQKRELQQIARIERQRTSKVATAAVSRVDDGGSGTGDGSFALGSSLFSTRKFQDEVEELKKSIRASAVEKSNYNKLVEEAEALESKILTNLDKNDARQEEIAELTKKRNAAAGQAKAIQTRLNKGLIKNKDAVKNAKIEQAKYNATASDLSRKIADAERSYQGLVRAGANFNSELDESDRKFEALDARINRRAKNEAKKARNSRLPQAGLAGAAFATVPGQDFLQAGAAGALIAGPKGAVVAALVAATLKVGNVVAAFGKQSAIAQAEVEKLKISLESVAGTNFEKSLETAARITKEFNTPLNESIANLTKLVAAGNSVGLEYKDIDTIIRGLSASNKALGGDQEKLNGILNAAIQILSKNKVQAEELRGQIGDRLPGAFGRFAESLKITGAELDQRLKDGKVTVADFVTFTEGELKKYEKTAQTIADSPAEAGERLKTALKNLELATGPLTASIGAKFQDLGTEIVKGLAKGAKAIENFQRQALQAQLKIEQGLKTNIQQRLDEVAPKDQSGPQVRALQARLAASQNRIQEIQRLLQPLLAKEGFIGPPAPQTATTKTTTEQDTPKPDPDAVNAAETAAERLSNARRITREKAAQLEIDRRLEEAILRQDRAEQAILQGERDVLLVRQRLAVANAEAVSEAEKLQLLKAAELDVDRISIRVQRELAEISRDKTTELKEQRDLLLQIAGIERTATGAKPIEDPTQDLRDELRGLQNQRKFGGDADLAAKVEDLVLNKGVPFNEAFDIAEQVKAQRELNAETEKYNQLLQSVGNTIETGIVDAISVGIDALVRGTEELDAALKDIAAGVLQDISRQLLSAAVSLGLRSLGGNDGVGVFSRLFPQREEGGPVSSGVSYLVGEKGPELFTPDRNGQIIDNDAFTAAASALRSSDSITPSEGEDSSEAFAQAAAALVRNTTTITNNSQTSNQALMAESMQASMAASKEPIRLQTTVINSVEYATVEQVGEAMKQTKKQAEAEVFTKLKNRPSVRRSVGM